jgi:hypothetical protein
MGVIAFPGCERKLECNARPLARGADDVKRCADLRGAFMHAFKAEVIVRRRGFGEREAPPFVRDDEGKAVGFVTQLNVGRIDMGVALDIG